MIGVLTALWRRPEISRYVLMHYAAMGVKVVAVRSPEDPEPLEDIEGVTYVEAPNEPLSDKWNAGMRELRGCDCVMIVGSDDFVSDGYLEEASRQEGYGVVRTDTVVFYDTDTGEARTGKMPRMGAGRVLFRPLLEKLQWEPWPTGLSRKLDGGMDRKIRKVGGVAEMVLSSPVLDVKSGVNLWSYKQMAGYARRVLTTAELTTLINTHYPMAKQVTKTEKADVKTEAKNEKPKTIKMIASRNIPSAVAGTERRVFRDSVFFTQPEFVRNLETKGLAKKA